MAGTDKLFALGQGWLMTCRLVFKLRFQVRWNARAGTLVLYLPCNRVADVTVANEKWWLKNS